MIELEAIRHCLEGAVPSCIATSDLDGMPNVSYVSQVHYVDHHHVALTFQFFNRTHRNIQLNPQATVLVTAPDTAAQFRLELLFRNTLVEGPLFHAVKAKLAGIASETGMSSVFELKGVDIYRVLDVHQVQPGNPTLSSQDPLLLPALKDISLAVNTCDELGELFDVVVTSVSKKLFVPQVTLLLADECGSAVYAVASSTGTEGVGAEIPFGFGIIGVCAQEKVPLRIAFGTSEYSYRNAIVHYSRNAKYPDTLETAIPFPEMARPGSQLAVPIVEAQKLFGVLYLESERKRRFSYDDEDALCVVAELLAARYRILIGMGESDLTQGASAVNVKPAGNPVAVRYYAANHSVFIDNNYLIKGVAGAILWRILRHYESDGRQEFTNRELRLDASLGLPEISDNLESRLVLLQKRLAERCSDIALEKSGRGRFRLALKRPIHLNQCS